MVASPGLVSVLHPSFSLIRSRIGPAVLRTPGQPIMLWSRCGGSRRLFSSTIAPSKLHGTPLLAALSCPPGPQLRRPHRSIVAGSEARSTSPSRKAEGVEIKKQKQQQTAAGQERQLSELDEIIKLVQLLPPAVKGRLESHPQLLQLVEVVMDLGRPPLARFPSGDEKLCSQPVSEEDLQFAVAQVGEFGGDNRAGIDKTLHRISCIRNRSGRIVGLTCRVGRAIAGSAAMVDDLIQRSASVLMLGRPGVGKTTAIREISRKLADDCFKRVVIVDTSNEIGGDGDIPHPGIGNARRMQVPHPDQQHRVMIEAVENHMPEVIVIDEIGTEAEALAARTIAQRGVQLVATAHGNELENVMKNPSLNDLVGGISSVTLGDEEAKRRGVQKSILERAAPPTFDVAVEMVSREQWRVHLDVGRAVDMLLSGQEPSAEVRERDADGRVWAWPEDMGTDSEGEDGSPEFAMTGLSSSSRRQRPQQSRRQRQGGDAGSVGDPAVWERAVMGGSGSSSGFPEEALRVARRGLIDPQLGTFAGAYNEAARASAGPRLLEPPAGTPAAAAAAAAVGDMGEGGLESRSAANEPQQPAAASASSSVSSSSSSRAAIGSSGVPGGPTTQFVPATVGAGPSSSNSKGGSRGGSAAGGSKLRLYSYGVDEGSLWSVGSALRLEGRLELCSRLEDAEAVLALRSKLKNSAWVKEAAKAAGIPVFSIKSAGVGDVTRALRTLLGIDPSPGSLFADEGALVAADPRSRAANSRNSRPEASIAQVEAASRRSGGRQGALGASGRPWV